MSGGEREWSDLPPELLAAVSDRLHDDADFIRFHAVCKPWRDSLAPITTTSEPRHTFFPWLIDASPSGKRSPVIRLRSVFSRRGYYTAPAGFSTRSWVARADGTAPWFYPARLENTLVHPLAGDAATLPPFGDDDNWWRNSPGVVYGDGTIFLYDLSETFLDKDFPTSFAAAILRPGDTSWTFVETGFKEELTYDSNRCFATYCVDDGKILVCVAVDLDRGHDIWHLLVPSPAGVHDTVVENDDMRKMTMSPEPECSPEWRLDSSHVLESRGELLRVSVLVRWHEHRSFVSHGACGEERSLVVLVHALEEGGGGTARWARRDGRSFTDRVLFLGFPTSFAMEAAKLGGGNEGQMMIGGCVYFLQESSRWPRRVFRYSLVDGKTKIVDRLPREWSSPQHVTQTWFVPQPAIAPIQAIRERLKAPKADKEDDSTVVDCTIHEDIRKPKRNKEPFFSFVVQNLPPGADSSWLRRFFSKHGDVSVAEVTTPGKGRVTMAIATVFKPDDAKATLDGLVMGGCALTVSCGDNNGEPCRSPPNHHT